MFDDSSSESVTSAEDKALLAEFQVLWDSARAIWDRCEHNPEFHAYVSADYLAVFHSLAQLRGRAWTFLEWGSGLGVATIMASRMGFEAYGIEAEEKLIEHAEMLAEAYAPNARFAHGSFIPDDFAWNPAEGDDLSRTIIDLPSAYDELDIEIRDLDLIYVYPWPGEHGLHHSIMRQYAGSQTLLLSYDVREGTQLTSFGSNHD